MDICRGSEDLYGVTATKVALQTCYARQSRDGSYLADQIGLQNFFKIKVRTMKIRCDRDV